MPAKEPDRDDPDPDPDPDEKTSAYYTVQPSGVLMITTKTTHGAGSVYGEGRTSSKVCHFSPAAWRAVEEVTRDD